MGRPPVRAAPRRRGYRSTDAGSIIEGERPIPPGPVAYGGGMGTDTLTGTRPAETSRRTLGVPVKAAAVGVVVLVSRLPFIATSPGADPDAWRNVLAGMAIREHGTYVASRPPGYLLVELANAALPPLGVQLFTATLSAVAAVLLGLLLRRRNVRAPWVGAGIFAATSTVWIASTTTMGYVWAVALLLAAMLAADTGHPAVAGILAGLIAAVRLPWLPLALLPVIMSHRKATTGSSAALVAGLSCLPFLWAFGLGPIVSQADHVGHPGWLFATREVLQVWGSVGLVAVAGTAIAAAVCAPRHSLLWVAGTAGGVALFAMAPLEDGYLIVAVPFVAALVANAPVRWVPYAVLAIVATVGVSDAIGDAAVRRAQVERYEQIVQTSGVYTIGGDLPGVLATAGVAPSPGPVVAGDGIYTIQGGPTVRFRRPTSAVGGCRTFDEGPPEGRPEFNGC